MLFARLPGVGEKTAQRYVLHLLTADPQIAKDLGSELATLHEHVRPCERCGNIADVDPDEPATICAVCKDTRRDPHLLCVVGRVHDLMAIERTGSMRGRYFVLGRLLSPLEGIGPEEVLMLMPSAEGTSIEAAAGDQGVRSLLEGGATMAEAVLPKTRPLNPSQLALFGEKQ